MPVVVRVEHGPRVRHGKEGTECVVRAKRECKKSGESQ